MHLNKIKKLFILPILFLSIYLTANDIKPGQVYNNIIKKKEIRIGISKNYPPLNFNSGKRGLEIDLARRLGNFFSVEVKLIPLNVAQYTSAIQRNEVDIVIAGFSRNLKRAKKIWFSEPYLSLTPAVLADRKSLPQTSFGEEFEQDPIKTIWDIKRISSFKLAVKKGSSYEHLLKTKFADMPRVLVKTNEEGLNLLKRGKVNGFVHDSIFLQYLYNNSAKLRGSCNLLHGGSQREKNMYWTPVWRYNIKKSD